MNPFDKLRNEVREAHMQRDIAVKWAKEIEQELEYRLKACAEMRALVEGPLHDVFSFAVPPCCYSQEEVLKVVVAKNHAISSDCGKDFVHRSELDKANAACAEMRDALRFIHDECDWGPGDDRIGPACKKALANIKVCSNGEAPGINRAHILAAQKALANAKNINEHIRT